MSTPTSGGGKKQAPPAEPKAEGTDGAQQAQQAQQLQIPADVLQQLREAAVKEALGDRDKLAADIRREVAAELKAEGAAATEGGGGKIRQIDARASSLEASLAIKAEQRALLSAPENLPEGYVRCVPLRSFFVDGKDVHGVSDIAVSIELHADPDAAPIMLREGLAAGLQKQKLLTIVK